MKIAFLTEMGVTGKIPANYPNMRTEFAWMHALDAEHFSLFNYKSVSGFDFVFIIWPKGNVELNAEGLTLSNTQPPRLYNMFCSSGTLDKIIPTLKSQNGKVCFVQEGPSWFPEDYSLTEQIYHEIILDQSDAIFCHNEADKAYYSVYGKQVAVMRTLLIEDSVKQIVDKVPIREKKLIIGGNFCRWYGGMKSYKVSKYLIDKGYEAWVPSMHNKRPGEEILVKHLPYLSWIDWMKELSTFKIGVHMMPTVAAGTFSLNCAYLGIPVIGNEQVDTQRLCHPELSVAADDVSAGSDKAYDLWADEEYWAYCSKQAYTTARELFIKEPWLKYMTSILEQLK